MKFILGRKQHMVQIFDDKGQALAATVISAGPVVVTHVKKQETDGYSALQVGYGTRKAKNVSKPVMGHLKDLGPVAHLRELRLTKDSDPETVRGMKFDASAFAEGDVVEVSAISKAKGFQGGVKRHGFHGGPRTHGQKHSEREPGSLGAGGYQRVFKGRRMAGRMGADRVTVKNLRILKVDAPSNTILISGAIPGRRGTLIEVRG